MPPTIAAHRGFWSGRWTENSRPAFQKAADYGFPSECDIWPTADGEPVVIHDETVDRTTDGHGPITSFRANQLTSISLNQASGSPPLLRNVADLVRFIEIKPPDSADLIRRVIEIMGDREWMLQSFDAVNLIHARRINPNLPIAFLADDAAAVQLAIVNNWRVHLNHELLDAPLAQTLRDKILPFGVWTVNEDVDIRRVVALGPDLIITDRPLRVRDICRKIG